MSTPYTPPEHDLSAFNCPFCGAYANQRWYPATRHSGGRIGQLDVADCVHCDQTSIWYGDGMIHPLGSTAPMPNPDTPEDILPDYLEARDIASRSPRGAAALLRLCIQKLCKHLGESGENINDDIKNLVKKGLPQRIQQALDVVRVVGNESVHPGELDIRDKPEVASAIFGLFNLTIENRISEPNRVKAIYDSLPATKIVGIEARDKTE